MLKKLIPSLSVVLLIATFLSIKWYPTITPLLGIAVLFCALAISTSSIFEKHKQTENPRPKIFKDILILIVTFLLIIFLGGLAGIFANYYASPRFGVVAGLVAALAASFAVGYFVKKGAGKIFR